MLETGLVKEKIEKQYNPVKATQEQYWTSVKASGQSCNILFKYDKMVLKCLIYSINRYRALNSSSQGTVKKTVNVK